MKTYTTSEIAKIVNLHPNTIRRYEEWGLIPKPARTAGNYRIFTDYHVDTIKLAQLAFQIEVLQSGLRRKMIEVIKSIADYDFLQAEYYVNEYHVLVNHEIKEAEQAIASVEELLDGASDPVVLKLKRSDVCKQLGITIDALRNWELNGLLPTKRKKGQQRLYSSEELKRLQIIRTLRSAKYSLESILRLLNTLDKKATVDIYTVLHTPAPTEDIISVCDKLILSLEKAKSNASLLMQKIAKMKKKYQ